jgi:DNA-binding transcriptional LysR family regulator
VISSQALSQFNESFSELSEFLTGSGGRLTIAALPFFAVGTLPGAIAAFTRNRKGVSFVLKQSNAVPLLDELVEGSIDFAVTARPVMSNQFQFQPMITDDYVLLCRHDDVLAEAEPEFGPVPWSAFEGRQFIAAASSSSVRAATDQIFQQQGITVDAAFEVANWAMVPRLVGEGLGVAALPRMVATMGDCSKLRIRTLTPAVHRSVGIVTIQKRTLSPLASSFIDHLLTFRGTERCP